MILHKDNFENYAKNHMGISSKDIHQYANNNVVGMTPNIIEDRDVRFSILNVYDKLLSDRIIYIGTPIASQVCNIINAQLLYLDSVNDKDIQMYIHSPGGEVISGLSTIDTMSMSKSRILTSVNGIAASMASVFLGAGVVGERSATRHSRVMIHAISSGYQGVIHDMTISYKQSEILNEELFELLGEYTKKDPKEIQKDSQRDLWLTSVDALEYGIIDKIYWSRDKIITLDNLHEVKK